MVLTCNFCDKTFEFKSYLERHQKSHETDKAILKYEEKLKDKDKDIKTLSKNVKELQIQIDKLEANRNTHYQAVYRLRKKIYELQETQVQKVLNYNTFNIYTSCDADKFEQIMNTLKLDPAQVNIYKNFIDFHYLNEDNIPAEALTYIHNLLFDERFEESFTASFTIKKVCMYIFENLYKNQLNSIKLFNKKYRFVLLFVNGEWKTYKFTEVRNNLYNSFKKIAFFCLNSIKHNKHYSNKLVKTIKKEWNDFHLAELNHKLQTVIAENNK